MSQLFSGGPKSYAYSTHSGKEVCKIKGFTLNYKNNLVLNLNSVKTLLLRKQYDSVISTVNENKITRDGKRRRVFNREEIKIFKIMYDKRRLDADFTTKPFGY